MASISTDSRGNRRILFVNGDGRRKQIRLGKLPLRTADTIKTRVEHLNAAKIAGHGVDGETARWLSQIDDVLANKLAAVGLIPKRQRQAVTTLGKFLAEYIASRTDIKPLTLRHLKDAERSLTEHFGADRPLADVSPRRR